jgi:hypothetical protein
VNVRVIDPNTYGVNVGVTVNVGVVEPLIAVRVKVFVTVGDGWFMETWLVAPMESIA